MTPEIAYQSMLRDNFGSFAAASFSRVFPSRRFSYNWHLDLMASTLQACSRREIKRLILMVPPRSGKSLYASIAFPAWLLGQSPSTQIICASYAQELSSKLSTDTRSLMQSAWYRSIFGTRLASHKQSALEFATTRGGHRLATSVGGTLTGRGADLIIIDDPLKPDEAISDTQRKAVNEWYDNTVYTRLNDKADSVMILIMQRLHLNDLVGHVLEREPWTVVSLPAICTEEQTFTYKTAGGTYRHTRKVGDILHPDREPAHVLEQIRNTIGEYNFSAQYQQAPVPLGGGLVKSKWLQYYEPEQCPKQFEQVVQSWDTANKASEVSNYSVCTTWGIQNKKIYLLDVLRQRVDYPDLKRLIFQKKSERKPSTILIEDRASGQQLIQELKQDGVYEVTAIQPIGDKFMRMHAQTGMIEGGDVLFPCRAPWLESYVLELTSFPNAKFDDQVDSTSQALCWIKIGQQVPNGLLYAREEARRRGVILRPR
jgi:predicted phage terminase large subunit-like protein